MDNVCHTLTGWALARAAGPIRPSGTTLALILASNLPDIDVVLTARAEPIYLFQHRGITHSLAGLILFPPILALGLWWGYGRSTRLRWFCLLGYLGVAVHILYDLATSWGTMLLYPFDRTRFALDWLFIVDPVLWVLPIVTVYLSRCRPRRSRQFAVVMAISLGGYLATGGILQASAERSIRSSEAGHDRTSAEIHAIPRFGAPLRWNGIAVAPIEFAEPRITRYTLAGFPFQPRLVDRIDRGFENPWVARAFQTRAGQGYLWWARVPVATTTVSEDGRNPVVVRFRDLRYTPTVAPAAQAWTPFGVGLRFEPRTGELLGVDW